MNNFKLYLFKSFFKQSQITQSDSSSCICHRKSKCTLPDPPIFFSCLRNLVLPFPEIRRYIIPFRPLLRWKNDIICLLCFAHRYSHPPLSTLTPSSAAAKSKNSSKNEVKIYYNTKLKEHSSSFLYTNLP